MPRLSPAAGGATFPVVTLPLIVILILVAVAILYGGNRPVKVIAALFLVIGFWVSQTTAGEYVKSGLDELARLVG